MNSTTKKYPLIVLVFVFLLLTTSISVVTAAEASPTLEDIAAEIIGEEGVIISVTDTGSEEAVFVFEERHDSVLGQVEITMMLTLLYEDYDLRLIGLEGHPVEEGPLDLSWAHEEPYYQPEQPITNREDVFIHTLQEGEIGGAEIMGLVFYDVVVAGIDSADLYTVTIDPDLWFTPYTYNYQLMVATMGEDEFSFWRALIDKNETEMAYDYALQTSEYGQEMIERLEGKNSAAAYVELLDELETELADYAAENDETVPVEMTENLKDLREYIDVVDDRSDAIVAAMLDILAAHSGESAAMTIGVMHTERVVELLTEAGVSTVVIRPTSLEEDNSLGLLSPEAYRRKQDGFSVAPAGYLGSLLDGRGKKPPPSTTNEWYLFDSALRIWIQEMAHYAAEGNDVTTQEPRALTGPDGQIWAYARVKSIDHTKTQGNPFPTIHWIVEKKREDGQLGYINILQGSARVIPDREKKRSNVDFWNGLAYAQAMILGGTGGPAQEPKSGALAGAGVGLGVTQPACWSVEMTAAEVGG